MNWLLGFAASTLISGAAYWKRSLSASGALGALVVGTILYGAGTIGWYGVLLAFFLSSSVLTKWKHARKAKWEEGYDKTGRRDWGQVVANGGLAALFCLFHSFWPHSFWYAGFLGIMASVTADTWATEIGSLSKEAPRSILTGKPVIPGTSGAISKLGLLASIAGGCMIGIISIISAPEQFGNASAFLIIGVTTLAGLMGSLLDSLLGATVQANYRCQGCGRTMEKRQHCNQPTQRIQGYSVINNDLVNLISSLGGAIVSILLFNLVRL